VFISSIGATYKNLTLPTHAVPIADSVRLALLLVPTAILASYAGGWLTHKLPQKVLRTIFIVFMLTVAALTFHEALAALRRHTAEPEETPVRSSRQCPLESRFGSRPSCEMGCVG
jgi:hypothetical protein